MAEPHVAIGEDGTVFVLQPSGEWKPTQVVPDPKTNRPMFHNGQGWESVDMLKGKSANEAAPPLDNLMRGVARGATLGFVDELAAAGNATFGQGQGETWGQRYSSNLDAERGRDKAYDATNPLASAGAQIGGAVLGSRAVPLLQPFKGAGTPAALGNTAVNSALGGAIAGFGEGEGAGDRLKDALSGGALGAVAGPALHGVFDLGQRSARKIGNVMGWTDPNATGERLMARSLMRDKIAPEELAARAGAATDPQILADMAGRNTVGLSALVARTPSDAPQVADTVMALRRDARPDRIAAAIGKTLGGGAGSDVADATDTLIRQRSAAARPLYEKAMAADVKVTDALADILQDTDVKGAISKEIARQRKEIRGTGAKLEVNTMRTLDAAKKGLDELIDATKDPVTRQTIPGKGADRIALESIRNRLVDEVDAINPAYAEARKVWAGPSQALDALAAGRKALSQDRDTVAKVTRRLDDQTRPFFELGAGRSLSDMTSDPAKAGGVARRLTEDRQMGERLASVLPDMERRNMLADALRREAGMAKNDRIIAPSAGSQTQPLQALGEDVGNEPLVARLLMNGRTGGIGGAVSGALSEVYRRGQGINSSVADALAPQLFGAGPEAIQKTLEAIRARQIADETARRLIGQQFQKAAVSGATSGALLTN